MILDELLCTESISGTSPFLMDIGVIGWNLLKEFNILFDYENKQFTLYKHSIIPDIIDISNWFQIKLNTEPSLTFSAQIRDYNENLRFGIDTGSIMIGNNADNCTVKNWIRTNIPDNILSKYSISYFLSNRNFPIIEDISITSQNTSISNLDFLYYQTSQPNDRDGFLGGDFFSKYIVFLDNENNIMYFQKY